MRENSTVTSLPRQKIPIAKKTDKWRRENIDAAIAMIGLYNNSRRSDRTKKQKNYDMLNGKINRSDFEYSTNPFGLDIPNFSYPATIQPYDVWSPIFYELFGEESRRPFNFIVRAINEDAVSEKEVELKAKVIERLQSLLMTEGEPNEELSAIHKMTYSYQDMRESTATKILNYLKKDLDLDMVFQKGWEDGLVAGEEIYAVEELSNEPRMRRVNPLELYFILPHNSDLIDDAEVIVEETYMSLSQIIDNFYEKLKPHEIAKLENDYTEAESAHEFASDIVIHEQGYIPEFMKSSSPIRDTRGNYRVYKVTWKSKKKLYRVTATDPETGEQYETIVSEEYYSVDNGEILEELWINEYWEGYQLGKDLYIAMGPKKNQYRRMDNISSCRSGYVGSVYSCNNSQSVSLMDRLTPFIYLYVILWYNTELAISTNWGKIAMIDVSLIPNDWTPDIWLHYARIMKVGFVDSYSEGKKGERKGKLNQSTQNKELNLETGNYIQQHVTLLQYIEQKIKTLAGVPDQRMGDIAASELVGNTERAVVQSSYVTEPMFKVHNFNKRRALTILIETAKSAWSGKSKKMQYVTDEMSTAFLSIDKDEFLNSEFGVFTTDSSEDLQVLDTLKTLMQAALQNDKIELSSVVDTLSSKSIADVRNKLLESERQAAQKQQEMIEQQNQGLLQAEQMRIEHEQMVMENDNDQNELDRENNITIAEIKAMGFSKDTDVDNNGTPDVLEVEKLRQKDAVDREKLTLDRQKMHIERLEKEKQRKHEEKMKKEDMRKAKMDNETKVRVAKMKPKPKPPSKK